MITKQYSIGLDSCEDCPDSFRSHRHFEWRCEREDREIEDIEGEIPSWCTLSDIIEEGEKIEKVARAICISCKENPNHVGDARGNDFRWQDYIVSAVVAIKAIEGE